MKRATTLVYGIVCYVLFLAIFLYLIGFVWGLGVPKGINEGAAGATLPSILINVLLVSLFGLQHTIMARPGFKSALMTVVTPAAERSTFVLFTNLCLAALFYGWQPLTATIWDVRGAIAGDLLFAASALGGGLVLLSTFVIDHFALFGLKQVIYGFVGREMPETDFVVRGPYHLCRHPLMLGFLIAFWATPWMTLGHALFAAAMTVYILIALRYEERDLGGVHGEAYARYREETPMLLPRLFSR
jgi:protein-S-isoprenylcysteine O-methyltransferase Ste14